MISDREKREDIAVATAQLERILLVKLLKKFPSMYKIVFVMGSAVIRFTVLFVAAYLGYFLAEWLYIPGNWRWIVVGAALVVAFRCYRWTGAHLVTGALFMFLARRAGLLE